MHLLATTTGVVDGGATAVDLKQSPGDIVILSAADSELAALALASDQFEPSLRLANLLQLQHNYSVDLYTEQTLRNAKLIIVRLLGGKAYWPYGVASLLELSGVKLVLLPGGTDQDVELKELSTVGGEDWEALRSYFASGGSDNIDSVLRYAAWMLGSGERPGASTAFSSCSLYQPSSRRRPGPSLAITVGLVEKRDPGLRRDDGVNGTVCVVFYRSVVEGGQTAPINALINQLTLRGFTTCAIYVSSLKDQTCQAYLREHFAANPADVIINATSFAVGNPEADVLAQQDCPVLQVTLGGNTEEQWRDSTAGLAAKDLAMSVVLPELDGRIYAGVISFKADHLWHEKTQCRIVTYKPVADRIQRVAELAENWCKLRTTPNAQKRVAIILANYPNKDGRIANGVGYDTPASTINILKAMQAEGYLVTPPTTRHPREGGDPALTQVPSPKLDSRLRGNDEAWEFGGNDLIEALQANRKNSAIRLSIQDYKKLFQSLPGKIQSEVTARWGNAENDPFARDGELHLPFLAFGNTIVGIQPARGYNIDPKATYHDPSLMPPHGYIAAYLWLRHIFNAHAIIHNGKHGNLEWLPGKSVGLSETCYPDAILGPIPHIYPFIVNDPGEGTAAKRRASAVIIDHLTPPLTRAESYGPLKDLEALVDEYYLASGLDRRRMSLLKQNILDLTRHHNMDKDAGFTGDDDSDLQKLDTFLCDLKEAQIRDGLHILGESPTGQQETDLLVALTRVPSGERPSLIRAIADDLELGFDPLNCEMGTEWRGPRPQELLKVSTDPWRTVGDTVERLELHALSLISSFPRTRESRLSTSSPVESLDSRVRGNDELLSVLTFINQTLRPTLASCGPSEITNLLRALNGQSVPPGPSGAPTRGRLDVLPTGRNFYSIDNRTLPTPAAWTLGKLSADALLTRHFQDTGQHLKNVGLSCWGTANMRTGGDDLAQAMWLMGVKPVWDTASWRVTGFEVQPLAVLGRPRVDVTLRISGFFRDAFPAQIELLDKAITAVAALEEDAEDNPLAASLSTARIFGSKPGAYGAGLQALIDEGIWSSKTDLAAAYVTWGAYVYGTHEQGRNDETAFRERLDKIEAVIHNQDNREHDLLDSDDYYQFEGGMSAAVETASGKKPRVYHNDHSRPERPVIRTLDEEISRVMRSRVVNPKWINGVKRHGYKGAFEIAATVDYMFAFAATADAVKSHHFDLAYDAYIEDDVTRQFMANNNPAALREMSARFQEAITRGLWQPRLNSVHDRLKDLIQ
jgi:cobaltochelatase CobN